MITHESTVYRLPFQLILKFFLSVLLAAAMRPL